MDCAFVTVPCLTFLTRWRSPPFSEHLPPDLDLMVGFRFS